MAKAHQLDYQLVGDDMQGVIVNLDPREAVQAEAGAMMFLEEGIRVNTGTGGGFMKGLKRVLVGESFFITTFYNESSGKRKLAFSAPYPGKILAVPLHETGPMLCQRDAYLCSAYGIDISVAFTKRLGAGFFGGEGFILQRLSGDGLAFIHAGGTLLKKTLQARESLRVDTGCLVAFTQGIDFDIERAGNLKSMFFGGEGLFLATLSGTGLVMLQSLPLSRLADRIVQHAPSAGGSSKGEGSVLGQLGNMFGD